MKSPKYLCVGFYNLIFMVRVPFGNERPAGSENKEVQDPIALWLLKQGKESVLLLPAEVIQLSPLVAYQ